jgi:hypothetical protein
MNRVFHIVFSEFCIYSLQTHEATIFCCRKNMWENRVQDHILEMDRKKWFLRKPLRKKYFGNAPPNKRSREKKSFLQIARTEEHISRVRDQ